MGIHRLMPLLLEKCPDAIKTLDLKTYTGRSVACDASMVYKYNNKVNLPIPHINSTCKARFRNFGIKR